MRSLTKIVVLMPFIGTRFCAPLKAYLEVLTAFSTSHLFIVYALG